ncbi:hypothetical protein [Lysobacter gummosus]
MHSGPLTAQQPAAAIAGPHPNTPTPAKHPTHPNADAAKPSR